MLGRGRVSAPDLSLCLVFIGHHSRLAAGLAHRPGHRAQAGLLAGRATLSGRRCVSDKNRPTQKPSLNYARIWLFSGHGRRNGGAVYALPVGRGVGEIGAAGRGTALLAGTQAVAVWVLCLYFMGLNLSNEQIAAELDLAIGDAQAMTTQLREGIEVKKAGLPDGRN
jgi:hypothetical protein